MLRAVFFNRIGVHAMFKPTNSNPTYKTIAMSALATLFFCGATLQPAFAETKVKDMVAEAPADADFKKLDVNSDAKISLKEAVKDKTLATSFDVTDANKDGNISADEYASYKAAMQMKSPEAAPAANPVN
jgi:Ca2+-binding EF-hand superfamily protein